MNVWTDLSIQLANQQDYLDQLFRVYPCIPDDLRDIPRGKWEAVGQAFKNKDDARLLASLLDLDLFPIKDSYVAYLRRDRGAITRNPRTVNRLCGRLYELGINAIFQRCSEPKETNRQIGPLFRRWLENKSLGVPVLDTPDFLGTKEDCVLKGGDQKLTEFARATLNYRGPKGIDFIGRFNKQYVIGEAKFLTDFGGHQNAQFNDAITLLNNSEVNAVKVGVLDGVVYIRGQNKMHRFLLEDKSEYNIMSALVLRNFLYQL